MSVTLDTTALGDPVWTTSRGHTLTAAEARFTACDALVTPILIDSGPCPDTVAELLADGSRSRLSPAGTALDGVDGECLRSAVSSRRGGAKDRRRGSRPWPRTLLGTRIPLAVGRTARTATPAQRRALAARDRGCIIPGCAIPAEACQTHHVEDWASGGDD